MNDAADQPTHGTCLRAATERLRKAGIEDARHEARLLMQHATGLSRVGLISAEQDRMPADASGQFNELVEARCSRRPLQHILGTAAFHGLEFISDARALVPRPDSEIVVEAALRRLPEGDGVFVADLGTGSGCLLAAILSNRPLAVGVGVESSSAAASLARLNLARLGLEGRASVFEGSWTDWADWPRADLVISNPPYIASAEIPHLMPEVRDHDPHAALDGGESGLEAYREIVRVAADRMKPGAWLVFEIGHDQRETVLNLLETAGFVETGMSRDLGGNDRAVWGKRPIL